MTSISSIGGYQPQSPLDALENELSSEVSNGTVSSSDQGALTTALTDINNSLQSDASSSSPGDIKTKINDLIQQEVQNGTLTSSQATELQNVFANTFSQGGPGGPGGAGGGSGGGPGGPGGPGGSGASSSSDSTSSGSSASTALEDLLKFLKEATSTTTSYDSSGQTSTATSTSVVNYQS